MQPARKVLVVEDDDPIRRWIVELLRREGFEADEASDGAAGLAAAQRPDVDLVLLDLVMPKMDGLDVLMELRKVRPALPVIIVSARISEDDRVRGLQLGADDYVAKPFSGRELLARIEAVLRRRPSPVVRISSGNMVIDCARREATDGGGRRVSLSQIDVDILRYMAQHSGRPVSRNELLANVWDARELSTDTRAVEMHMARLRQKLSALRDATRIDWIVTVHGQGYLLGPTLVVTEES